MTETLVQTNPSNIRNETFSLMASLNTGALQSCQKLDHCPIRNKIFAAHSFQIYLPLGKYYF